MAGVARDFLCVDPKRKILSADTFYLHAHDIFDILEMSMKRVRSNDLFLWQFESMSNQDGIRHFVSSRLPAEDGREFTLSFSSSSDREEIRRNRSRLAQAMGIDSSRIVFPSQVHKTRVVHVTSGTVVEDLLETDALITDEKGICLAVMSADCVPVLLYDKRNRAVAAIHAGWRGTVAKIVEATLDKMSSTFGTKADDLIAAIGPSVCQESYEVGEEVIREVNRSFGINNGLMIEQPNNKARLDLWEANKRQLLGFGIPAHQIEVSDLCTVKNNDQFFSARRGDSGRFAAGIMLV